MDEPSFVYLYFALKVAAHGLTELFNESNKWKTGVEKAALQANGELYTAGLRYHGVAMLAMAAFGVPAFTAEDEPATYVCLVPLAAGLFMYSQWMAAGTNTTEEVSVENNAVPADEVVPEVAEEKQEEAETEEGEKDETDEPDVEFIAQMKQSGFRRTTPAEPSAPANSDQSVKQRPKKCVWCSFQKRSSFSLRC